MFLHATPVHQIHHFSTPQLRWCNNTNRPMVFSFHINNWVEPYRAKAEKFQMPDAELVSQTFRSAFLNLFWPEDHLFKKIIRYTTFICWHLMNNSRHCIAHMSENILSKIYGTLCGRLEISDGPPGVHLDHVENHRFRCMELDTETWVMDP